MVAVESDRRAAEVIRRNAAETKLGVRVVPVTVEKYLGGEPQQFELCWLDPPYAVPGQTVSSVVDRLAYRAAGARRHRRGRTGPARESSPGPIGWVIVGNVATVRRRCTSRRKGEA